MLTRQWIAAAAVVFTAFTVLTIAAPFMAPYGTFQGLDGSAGLIDHGWQGHGPAGAMYLLGDLLCHQQEARSYVLNGSQLPLCIRDVGIVAGLASGFAVAYLLHLRLTDRRWALVGAVLVIIMGIEWLAETQLGDMPVPRLLSGVSAGVGAAIFLGWVAYRDPVHREGIGSVPSHR